MGAGAEGLTGLLAPSKRQLSTRVKNQQGKDGDKAKAEQFTFPVTP